MNKMLPLPKQSFVRPERSTYDTGQWLSHFNSTPADPRGRDAITQKELEMYRDKVTTDGKVQVVPYYTPAPIAAPAAWPPIPPAYTPNARTWVKLPWWEYAPVPEPPTIDTHSNRPIIIHTSMKNRVGWVSGNPGRIDTRTYDDSPIYVTNQNLDTVSWDKARQVYKRY